MLLTFIIWLLDAHIKYVYYHAKAMHVIAVKSKQKKNFFNLKRNSKIPDQLRCVSQAAICKLYMCLQATNLIIYSKNIYFLIFVSIDEVLTKV